MHLYIISEGPEGPVKIGVCRERITQRLKGVQTGNPRKLRLVAAFLDLGYNIEHAIHLKLKDVRMMGEWFNLSEEAARRFILGYLADRDMPRKEIRYENVQKPSGHSYI